ncbi:hypothetical protein ACQP2F_29965 [Actinoplanes sp. CA-030573]|uniref:hypothetical protein n=1 Tax=Actinoplanes sp. CA-030573 TaxID=3239898 RepID=UPI003D8D6EF4
MGLVKRPWFRRIMRYLRRSAGVPERPSLTSAPALLAATREWEREQPEAGLPGACGVHAELRAAAHLDDTTDA